MSGYGQFCAVARALDVLGERWTLLIVRELLLGASSFGDLCRGLPRIPRATLSARLRTLRAAGIVDDYHLTEAGAALAPVVRELARWAITTDSAALGEDDLDTAALTWDMRRRVDASTLPRCPTAGSCSPSNSPIDRHPTAGSGYTCPGPTWTCAETTLAHRLTSGSPRRPERRPNGGSGICPGRNCSNNPECRCTVTSHCNVRCRGGSPATCSPPTPST
ncbi:winged helix-turn-helix transcriptional regulator [Nocardia sp. CA-128927]|uniref:winged helix-turn-helix transcriptional regulator n=1 Tax=Nocardia sp. CA-128927 TaxID=3239975 RepID=UPI003D963C2E